MIEATVVCLTQVLNQGQRLAHQAMLEPAAENSKAQGIVRTRSEQ
jgi:hypothetical protein